jgi:signal transduction histidine kinase
VRQYLIAAEPESAERCDDLDAVIKSVRASLVTELERQGVSWEAALAGPLPSVAIGSAMLEQILSGLAANALQAMPDGGTIRFAATASGGAISLTIADTGCGMTADQLRQAFKPFVTSKQSGLGLGLALARRILARHGGQINLASEVGRGTTVSLIVPVVA